MPSDTELTDSRGRPLHGRAKEVAEAAEVRRRAEAGQAATVRALSRAVVQLLARGAQSGPDVLRGLIGEADAIRVLRLAGLNAESVAANWSASAPVRPASQSGSDFWSQFPDHDPRYTSGRASFDQVAAEYRERTAAKAARPSVMWRTRDGAVVDGIDVPMGASIGPGGGPQQTSVVHRDVPELGSEEV